MWSELKASEPQTEDEVLTSFSPGVRAAVEVEEGGDNEPEGG